MKKYTKDWLVKNRETHKIKGIYAFESSPGVFKVGHSINVGHRMLAHPTIRIDGFVLTNVWIEDRIWGRDNEQRVHRVLGNFFHKTILGVEYFETGDISVIEKAIKIVIRCNKRIGFERSYYCLPMIRRRPQK